MAGRAVGAEAGKDVPGGKRCELAQGPDPEPDQQVSELDALEDADGPRGEEGGGPSRRDDEGATRAASPDPRKRGEHRRNC